MKLKVFQRDRRRNPHSVRNIIFAVALISLFLIGIYGVGLSAMPLSVSYEPVTNMPWTTWVSIEDASVGAPGATPYTVRLTDTWTSPPQLAYQPSGTSFDIDPDRVGSGIPPKYVNTWQMFTDDGPLPEVIFGISECWRTDNYGARSNSYAEEQPDGRYLYYFVMSAGIKTIVSTSSQTKWTEDPNPLQGALWTYETAMAQTSMHLKIRITPPSNVKAENFTASWGGATVFWTHAVTLGNNDTHKYPVIPFKEISDDPAYVPSDVEINQGVGGFNNSLGVGGGDIYLQLSAKLQAGAIYQNCQTIFPLPESHWFGGLQNPINVGVSFMVLFKVILSAPPQQPNIFEQIWLWIQDLFTILRNPDDPQWLSTLLIVLGVVVVVLFLIIPKKRKGQQGVIVYFGYPAPQEAPRK